MAAQPEQPSHQVAQADHARLGLRADRLGHHVEGLDEGHAAGEELGELIVERALVLENGRRRSHRLTACAVVDVAGVGACRERIV